MKLLKKYPIPGDLYSLLRKQHKIIFSRKEDELDRWIVQSSSLKIDELDIYVNDLQANIDAVKNAICYKYNHKLEEGSLNKKSPKFGKKRFDVYNFATRKPSSSPTMLIPIFSAVTRRLHSNIKNRGKLFLSFPHTSSQNYIIIDCILLSMNKPIICHFYSFKILFSDKKKFIHTPLQFSDKPQIIDFRYYLAYSISLFIFHPFVNRIQSYFCPHPSLVKLFNIHSFINRVTIIKKQYYWGMKANFRRYVRYIVLLVI